MPVSEEGQSGRPGELTAQVLAVLLRRIASGPDGEMSAQLCDALASIVRRPAPAGARGPGGAVELALLRQSPGDDRIARATADILLDRAESDPGFRAAFDSWCTRQRVEDLISEIASEASRQRKATAPRTRLARAARRPATWIAAAALTGAATYVSAQVAAGISSGAAAVGQSLGIRNGAGAPGGDAVAMNAAVDQGIGCEREGDVYPASRTPGLSTAFPPGTGPRRAGKTWDTAPGAFGAVPASPAQLTIYVTGPGDHAVIITGLTFHVTSRKKPVKGPWLNKAAYCGGAGSYRYGVVDLSAPPPYWQPVQALPQGIRSDAIKFPYTATANSPEALLVTVQMEDCDCTWYADLSWIDENTRKTTRIDDNGRPFETTSTTGEKETLWTLKGNFSNPVWTRESSRPRSPAGRPG